jgi:transposase
VKRKHFIGLDTHCESVEVVAVTASGKVKLRERCATTIPAVVAVLEKVPRPRIVAMEEGPLADWLWRNLQTHADEVVVCEPRRNHLIAKDSDKDDPIDAEKLANLLRGGYLKAVHHPETQERMIFKQHVLLYQERVRQRVAEANRIGGVFRRFGVFVRERDFTQAAQRQALLQRLPAHQLVRRNAELLWRSYDVVAEQVIQMRQWLREEARREEVIRRFTKVPGVKWVRGAQFFVIVDTPHRFRSKSALWRYLGLGLERRGSGKGPIRVQLVRRANRQIKSVLLGAARSAIRSGNNPFAEQHGRWIKAGCSPTIALRNTARSLAATLWGLWKNGSAYHPERVGAAAVAATPKEVGGSR